jgi:hypothetical protein
MKNIQVHVWMEYTDWYWAAQALRESRRFIVAGDCEVETSLHLMTNKMRFLDAIINLSIIAEAGDNSPCVTNLRKY